SRDTASSSRMPVRFRQRLARLPCRHDHTHTTEVVMTKSVERLGRDALKLSAVVLYAAACALVAVTVTVTAAAQETPALAHPADLAFEQARWEDAIAAYRDLLAESPEDRLSMLRIAQA